MEFLIPVKFSGVRYQRVTADTLDDALKVVKENASVQARYELNLVDSQFDVLAPRLMLSENEKETWPYWEYGYPGVDGVDWRVGYTDKGESDIPSFAETYNPVPADWLASWRGQGHQ